ncbi:efflux RND transporter permease subunit [Ketobacter sp.]|uniref:efflux RND transporter permease subunit n=1 Tax=Ketobacter sp. TaxID=2083498 RepID=UPI000F1F3A63|nr:efflux RND transporter permease subunit [Ketobacter sp.]RLT96952.1 MAG: efflux RND transporter permease subunit [Ketobacter sp.]
MDALIERFVRNPVAANLLMMVFLVAGYLSLQSVRSEIIPPVTLDMITVSVGYPGASPESVEQAIVNPIEAAIHDVEGVVAVSSRALPHMGIIKAELNSRYDSRDLLNDIKARVEGLDTLPKDSLKPVITELAIRNMVAYVIVSGNADERSLRSLATQVQHELLDLETISQVELSGSRDYQVSIDVSETRLQRYGLSFSEVAQAINSNSSDIPAGVLDTQQGSVAVRLQSRDYQPDRFEDLVVRATPDGGQILLGDVATINDGFMEGARNEFNGKPAAVLAVYRTGDQDIKDISKALQQYSAAPTTPLPAGISLDIWQDSTVYYNSRMAFLIQDFWQGGLLVFLVLLALLRSGVAFWISTAVPVSYLGSMILLPYAGVTLNMVSMFAYILVLGIVVDEAIVIGEHVFSLRRKGMGGIEAAIRGAQDLFYPMLASVLTTFCAFLPLLFLPGPEGQLMKVIPLVIMCTLSISVIEAAFCLPAHLSRSNPANYDSLPLVGTLQRWISDRLDHFLTHRYTPFLELCLHWRYSVVAAFVAIWLIAVGLVAFGWIQVTLFSEVEGDSASAVIRFSENAPQSVKDAGIRQLQQAAMTLQREFVTDQGEQQILSVFTAFNPDGSGHVVVEFLPSENRHFSGQKIVDDWRRLTGTVADMVDLEFKYTLTAAGTIIDLELSGEDDQELKNAAAALKARLLEFDGLYNIRDSAQSARQELAITLKPTASNLGLTTEMVAVQVRQAYHGINLQSISRNGGDVAVILRYSDQDRSSLWSLENMNLRLPSGGSVPLSAVADIHFEAGAADIVHNHRRRVIRVSANVDDNATSVGKVMTVLQPSFLDLLPDHYTDIHWNVAGAQKDRQEFMEYISDAYLLALMGMYTLMAFQFRSYSQPLIVMIAIPFGLIGALAGHLLMGMELTLWSLIGMMAVSGIVVNDNLVLIDFINDARRSGVPLLQAIRQAGVKKARAVILISLTTLVGVLPMIFERSLQAKFMIPMAVSLGFGTLFASTISLLLVPCLYRILADVERQSTSAPATEPEPGSAHSPS